MDSLAERSGHEAYRNVSMMVSLKFYADGKVGTQVFSSDEAHFSDDAPHAAFGIITHIAAVCGYSAASVAEMLLKAAIEYDRMNSHGGEGQNVMTAKGETT